MNRNFKSNETKKIKVKYFIVLGHDVRVYVDRIRTDKMTTNQ